MEKTINMAIDDFKKAMARAIMESGLPAIVMEPIIGDYYLEVAKAAQNALAADRRREKEEAEKETEEKDEGGDS